MRSGRVRCGECQTVFNALDSLIEEPMMGIAPPLPESSQQDLPALLPGAEIEAGVYAQLHESAVPPAPTSELAEEAPNELGALNPEVQEATIPEPAEAEEPEAADPITTATADESSWGEAFPEQLPPRRWPWAIGSILALTALGLQAVLAFRVELAILWPEAKPALVALCDIAGCNVGLPAKVALVGIEASDLYPDTAHSGRLALTATLKNRAPFTQQFPHLELTLTDTEDKAIARKVLAPADYLPPKASFADGMQPNADIMVAFGVDPGEIAASGYRLYLFYP